MTNENGCKYIQCWRLKDVLEILEKSEFSAEDLKNLYVIKKDSMQRPPNPFEIMSFKNLDWR